jgi:hypothetical protein
MICVNRHEGTNAGVLSPRSQVSSAGVSAVTVEGWFQDQASWHLTGCTGMDNHERPDKVKKQTDFA